MSRITVSAKTVEEAITEASIQLGLASTEFDYEVIEKGSAGFLGIGAKQAVITAWTKSEEKKNKKPMRTPDQVEYLKQVILDYNQGGDENYSNILGIIQQNIGGPGDFSGSKVISDVVVPAANAAETSTQERKVNYEQLKALSYEQSLQEATNP